MELQRGLKVYIQAQLEAEKIKDREMQDELNVFNEFSAKAKHIPASCKYEIQDTLQMDILACKRTIKQLEDKLNGLV